MKKEVKSPFIVAVLSLLLLFLFKGNAMAADSSAFTVEVYGDNCMILQCDKAVSGEIVVPEEIAGIKVTHINEKAFYKCKELTRVVLPETVTDIGNSAFASCTSLTEVVMGSNIQRIGLSAFSGCYKLKNITLSESLTAIPEKAFYLCYDLSNVRIGDKVKTIGANAFYCCTSLKSIVLPDTVHTVSAEAFSGCTSLTGIYLPANLSYVGKYAFNNCNLLNNVYYPGSYKEFGSVRLEEGNGNLIGAFYDYNHRHSDSAEVTIVPADCTNEGYSIFNCRCGYSFIGDYTEANGHSLSEVTVIEEQSCISDGVMHLGCSECDYYESVTAPAYGHSVVVDKRVEPSCTLIGKTQGSHCETCSEVFVSQSILEPLGHDFTVRIKNVKYLASKATYKKAALYYCLCSRCSAVSNKDTFSGEKLILGTAEKISFTSDSDSVRLTWSKVSGAAGYAVHIKQNGVWKLYKNTKATSITVGALSHGTTYIFAVKPYTVESGSVIYSPGYTFIKTATAPLYPVKINATQSNKAITLSWDKVRGAYGYRVFVYNAKTKKWVVMASAVKGNKFVAENLKSGVDYTFAVRPFAYTGEKVIWSEKYKSLTVCTRPASPVVKSTASKYSVKLEWDKINYAEGYVVYCSESPDSGYKRVAVTRNPFSKIENLKSGTNYYFKVYSYKKLGSSNVYSYSSPIKKVKTR